MQPPALSTQALENLEKLGRFWPFARQRLVGAIRAQLQALQLQASAQHGQLLAAQAQAGRQAQELTRLDEHGKFQQAQITDLGKQLLLGEQNLTRLAQQLSESQQRAEEIAAALDDAKETAAARLREAAQRIGGLETELSQQERALESCRHSNEVLRETNENWAVSQADLQENLQQITSQHLTLRQKFELVQSILALPATLNKGLEKFHRLILDDYRHFAARDTSLADKAGILLDLMAINQELDLIVNFPSARGKTLLAVAGGFSSGKSRFINSFISGGDVKLACGINPVTIVPSYVVCGAQPEIRGHAAAGGSIELSVALYGLLKHEFVTSFGFDLRRIMPFISVQVQMQAGLFEHLCLVDTPGYTPGGGQAAAGDHEVAQQLAGQSAAMIWVIGLDPAGTIAQSDLDFIEKTGLNGEALYILLNKADTKPASAIEDIMDEVEAGLESQGIAFAGICAYSSRKQQVYSCRGQMLEDFLRRHNHSHDVTGELEEKIDALFGRYRNAIKQDLTRLRARKKQLERFGITIMTLGGSVLYEAVNELCQPLESDFDTAGLVALERDCETLRKQFKAAVHATLGEVLNTYAVDL